jgi:hypothetical protein
MMPVTKIIRAERRAEAELRQKQFREKYPTVMDRLDRQPPPGARERAKLMASLDRIAKDLSGEPLSPGEAIEVKKLTPEQKKARKKQHQQDVAEMKKH